MRYKNLSLLFCSFNPKALVFLAAWIGLAGCSSVVAVADAAITVGATAVRVGASAVGVAADVAIGTAKVGGKVVGKAVDAVLSD